MHRASAMVPGLVLVTSLTGPAHAAIPLEQSAPDRADIVVSLPLEVTRLSGPQALAVQCEVSGRPAGARMDQAYRIEREVTLDDSGTLRERLDFYFDLPDTAASSMATVRCRLIAPDGRALCDPAGPYLAAVRADGRCIDTVQQTLSAGATGAATEARRDVATSASVTDPQVATERVVLESGTPVPELDRDALPRPAGTVLTADAPLQQGLDPDLVVHDPSPRKYLLDLKRMTIHDRSRQRYGVEQGGDEPWMAVLRFQGRFGDAANPPALLLLNHKTYGLVGPEDWGLKGAQRNLTAPWALQAFDNVRPYEYAGAIILAFEADWMTDEQRQEAIAAIHRRIHAVWEQALGFRMGLDYTDTSRRNGLEVLQELAGRFAQMRSEMEAALADGYKEYATAWMSRLVQGQGTVTAPRPDPLIDARFLFWINAPGISPDEIDALFNGALQHPVPTWQTLKFSVEAEQRSQYIQDRCNFTNDNDGECTRNAWKNYTPGAHWAVEMVLDEVASR